MNHIMLDLETLGVTPSAVILSLGAVRFDPNGDELGDEFYVTLNVPQQLAKGRTMDYNTVAWWMQQSDAARSVFGDTGRDVQEWLERFAGWANNCAGKVEGMWGNGADFDNVLLGSLYDTFGLRKPWSFGKNRCFRTLKNIVLPKEVVLPERTGTHHNAFDDAKYQALYLQAVVKALNLKV